MDVVILLVFISLLLVSAALIFFVYRLREGDFEHGERLALAPLNDGDTPLEERRQEADGGTVVQQQNTGKTGRR
jgi:cbb3-type cytochrome oxidase maturation protein